MKKRKSWKKAVSLVLSFLFILSATPLEMKAADYWPEGPGVESPCVIVMEASTGTVLYEKNSAEMHYPASITKILTTLVALENSELDEIVTFSDESINNTEGSGIARDYGEQMTMEQCLYAVMLESANECAYAVAEHVGGTMENFVAMMNAKAQELGCADTHFANPHGLHDESHYTSCHDMALIAQAAYQNETFRIITATPRYVIPPTNKHVEQTNLQNHNEMLYPYATTKYVYENCTGGKTGWTSAANSTLVTFAEKNGMTLICVVMNTQSPSQWTDSINLFDYCFDNFQLLNVAENETNYKATENTGAGNLNGNKAFVELDKSAVIVLPKTSAFTDAKSEISYNNEVSNVAGSITYTYAGRQVGQANIMTTGVEINGFVFDNEKEDENAQDVSTVQIRPLMIGLIICAVILLIILIFLIKYVYDNYHIIRHNMQVRKSRREQFKNKKKTKKRRKRRKPIKL